jgi:hypothetical protein
MVQGAVEIVEDGQQLAKQLLVGILRAVGEFLPGAPFVVLEVRGEPLIAAEARLNLVACRLELGIKTRLFLMLGLLLGVDG